MSQLAHGEPAGGEVVFAPRARRLISFVLPVYNEEGSLVELTGRIRDVMAARPEEFEIVYVDDGSTDASTRVIEELHAADPRVRLVQLRRNFGKSAAYSAGFAHAAGEVVITMDADLQDDPREVPLFLDKIDEGFDLVTGWKHKGKGAINKRIPSKVFNAVVAFVTGIRLKDFNCPFKAYRHEVVDNIQLYGELHRYIPVLAHSRGFSIAQIKISNLPRKHGRSKFGLERHVRGLLDLFTTIFLTRFAKRPLHLLGLGGLLAGGLGLGTVSFLVGAHFLYELDVLSREWVMRDRPALTLGILLTIIGVQFISLGLLGELFISTASSNSSSTTSPEASRSYSVKRVLGSPPKKEEDPDGRGKPQAG